MKNQSTDLGSCYKMSPKLRSGRSAVTSLHVDSSAADILKESEMYTRIAEMIKNMSGPGNTSALLESLASEFPDSNYTFQVIHGETNDTGSSKNHKIVIKNHKKNTEAIFFRGEYITKDMCEFVTTMSILRCSHIKHLSNSPAIIKGGQLLQQSILESI